MVLISILRTLILYILVVLALRIMGKRQIGELQPSELVVAIMISDLATIPMSDTSIPLFFGIAPIFTLVLCEMTVSFICMKSQSMRSVLTGRPATIIKNGKINQQEMRKARYSISDLLEELRMMNVFDIATVDCAVLETNGKISVITNDCKSDRGYVLICDGVIQDKILADSPYDKLELRKFMGKSRLKDIFILSVDTNKKVYKAEKE